MNSVYLFVYGTLRPGSPHAMAAFLAAHARYVGRAKMPGQLYDLGPYPGMIAPLDADDRVTGDIFDLADAKHAERVLATLDEYESATGEPPRLFQRRSQTAQLEDDGARVSAWYYCYNGDLSCFPRILTGDYLLQAERHRTQ